MTSTAPRDQPMHFVVNIAENASPATNASAKRKCTTKRFRRKPSNQQTEWQEEARRKYMKESRTRILDEWVGYPHLATFQSSTPKFSLYRGFSYLHGRMLLELQDEVAVLERELDQFDRGDKEGTSSQQLSLRSRAYDMRESKNLSKGTRTRRDILKEIRTKLVEYDDLLIKAREIAAFRKPSGEDYKSVKQWFFNNKPLTEAAREDEFITWKEDIVSLH
ncbi:hypothetical protein EV356DRAFT_141135 [Viridothelium virens]|uniref:DUF6594 domain-containing protein n=1 Tax=Viridothelium virens TaxID=1048519 RepID=A0A6A6HB25_VIRVR|nr:hypothetical protein EV356DRAFT_141135 [Viridothelium virens]